MKVPAPVARAIRPPRAGRAQTKHEEVGNHLQAGNGVRVGTRGPADGRTTAR